MYPRLFAAQAAGPPYGIGGPKAWHSRLEAGFVSTNRRFSSCMAALGLGIVNSGSCRTRDARREILAIPGGTSAGPIIPPPRWC